VVLEEAIENVVRGTVVDRLVAVGTIGQIAPTAQPAIVAAESFSIVSDGFANVRVTDV
jgi:hypothetical protein